MSLWRPVKARIAKGDDTVDDLGQFEDFMRVTAEMVGNTLLYTSDLQ